ncbi:MAG: helix-hairpin-helix domain-containing protein [Proteobacteria bacterium]|nr:helix-hairpin-helix domain-containing protein [Pseudomonadota bacterium]
MKACTREQLAVVCILLMVLLPLSLIHLHQSLSGERTTYRTTRSIVYEVRGDIKREGFYYFIREQTPGDILKAAGGSNENNPVQPGNQGSAAAIIKNGKKIIFNTGSGTREIRDMDAAARLNFFMPVDINSAAVDDLTLIPAIGQKTAESIVRYRQGHRGIRDVQELQTIPGLGEKKLKSLTPYITVLE